MDQLVDLIDYVRAEPRIAIGFAAAALAVYLLLQRKSRLQRDAEQRLASLSRERTGRYNSLRPPH
jgi:hypothetical protein